MRGNPLPSPPLDGTPKVRDTDAAAPRAVLMVLLAVAALAAGCSDDATDSSANPTTSAHPATDPSDSAEPENGVSEKLDRSGVVEVALAAAPVIMSLSADGFDSDVDAATRLMTPKYAEKFEAQAAGLRDYQIENDQTSTATAIAAGLVSIAETQAQVLVFADQITSLGGDEQEPLRFSVVLSMEKSGSSWLVDELVVPAADDEFEVADPNPERSDALKAAWDFAEVYKQMDYTALDAQLGEISAMSTPDFAAEYADAVDEHRARFIEQQVRVSCRMIATAMVEFDSDRASSLAVCFAQDDSLTFQRLERMEIDLVLTGGSWLVDNIQSVVAPDETVPEFPYAGLSQGS